MKNRLLNFSKKGAIGSSVASQFWQSLLATTMSIFLTFGVAAVLDHFKNKAEQREIVMMEMYDMYNSLQSAENANRMIYELMEIQCKVAEDTTLFEQEKFRAIGMLPSIDYTKSVESVFNSTIETILSVGNVLYEEDVSAFFQMRKDYKKYVSDIIFQEVVQDGAIMDLRKFVEYDYLSFAMMSNSILHSMREHFETCKQLIGVSDKELQEYIERRKNLDELYSIESPVDSLNNVAWELMMRKEEATRALGW